MKWQNLYPDLPLPVILTMRCLISPKADDSVPQTSADQVQLLQRTSGVDEDTFDEGWSQFVSEQQQYLRSAVGRRDPRPQPT